MFQRRHLVEDAAHGPEVWLVVVGLVLPDLGAEVVRGPDAGLGVVGRPVHDPGDPEVPEFDGPVFPEKDVLGFDVSVENLPLMDVLKKQNPRA